MIEKNKYEKIIDIINEPYKNKDVKPNFYTKRIFTDDIFIQFDTPEKKMHIMGLLLTSDVVEICVV